MCVLIRSLRRGKSPDEPTLWARNLIHGAMTLLDHSYNPRNKPEKVNIYIYLSLSQQDINNVFSGWGRLWNQMIGSGVYWPLCLSFWYFVQPYETFIVPDKYTDRLESTILQVSKHMILGQCPVNKCNPKHFPSSIGTLGATFRSFIDSEKEKNKSA